VCLFVCLFVSSVFTVCFQFGGQELFSGLFRERLNPLNGVLYASVISGCFVGCLRSFCFI
jgi:hypothetical protein